MKRQRTMTQIQKDSMNLRHFLLSNGFCTQKGTPNGLSKMVWRPFRLSKKFSARRRTRSARAGRRLWGGDSRIPAVCHVCPTAARSPRLPDLPGCPAAPALARASYITICTKFHSSLKP